MEAGNRAGNSHLDNMHASFQPEPSARDQITEPATTGVNVNEYRLVVESYKASYATFGQWSLLQDYYDTYRRIAAHPY